MSVKGAVLTLIALTLGGLLLFSRSGEGMLLGLSIITIAASATITALTRRGSDASGDAAFGRR
jgi:hypothetical protein